MDKKELLKRRSAQNKTEEVYLDDDFVVTVRALTREEVKACTHEDIDESKFTSKKDIERFMERVDRVRAENRMIATALVDPADMSEQDVAEWLEGAPSGDSVRIMDAITRLSGMADGQPKSDLQKNGSKS